MMLCVEEVYARRLFSQVDHQHFGSNSGRTVKVLESNAVCKLCQDLISMSCIRVSSIYLVWCCKHRRYQDKSFFRCVSCLILPTLRVVFVFDLSKGSVIRSWCVGSFLRGKVRISRKNVVHQGDIAKDIVKQMLLLDLVGKGALIRFTTTTDAWTSNQTILHNA